MQVDVSKVETFSSGLTKGIEEWYSTVGGKQFAGMPSKRGHRVQGLPMDVSDEGPSGFLQTPFEMLEYRGVDASVGRAESSGGLK